jgi:hypothetical protein
MALIFCAGSGGRHHRADVFSTTPGPRRSSPAALAAYIFICRLADSLPDRSISTRSRYELGEQSSPIPEGRYWKVRRSTPLEKVTNVDVRQGRSIAISASATSGCSRHRPAH